MKTYTFLDSISNYELALCVYFNRCCKHPSVARFFQVISRLGNGVFWYSLIIALPFALGLEVLKVSLHMTIVGLINLAIYKSLKPKVVRNRPYIKARGIQLHVKPLDEFSFPSGHTFHALSFTIIACSYIPELCWVLIPFAILVALSRIILGLHYPSDVLAGAILGTLMADLSFCFV
ncbi:MAG: phosphatase PAP2 family protein [Gammaproteobacteria bacterium]|nr:phosphatase PAP2 family protein [Gammaproteobacteria bacterium]